jgi:uncharacterized protein YndB with AHSA1/START domain
VEVEREVELDAPREEVWRALTEPERLREWLANDVELDVRPGGTGRFGWADGDERLAVVQEVDPGRRLVVDWWDDDAVSTVEITLDDADHGTRLTVTETRACAGEWSWAIELGLRRSSIELTLRPRLFLGDARPVSPDGARAEPGRLGSASQATPRRRSLVLA